MFDVVLIDDNSLDNYINQRVVEKSGIAEKITIFSSPEQALIHLEEHKQGDLLVFLDIQMPKLSGFDVLDKLMMMNKTENISVVMLSSSINPLDKDRALNYKDLVKNYLTKPLTREHLLEVVELVA